MKPTKLDKIKEKVYNTVSKLYNKRFEKYCGKYNELSDDKKDKLNGKFRHINLKLKDYDGWFTEEKKELNDGEE